MGFLQHFKSTPCATTQMTIQFFYYSILLFLYFSPIQISAPSFAGIWKRQSVPLCGILTRMKYDRQHNPYFAPFLWEELVQMTLSTVQCNATACRWRQMTLQRFQSMRRHIIDVTPWIIDNIRTTITITMTITKNIEIRTYVNNSLKVDNWPTVIGL